MENHLGCCDVRNLEDDDNDDDDDNNNNSRFNERNIFIVKSKVDNAFTNVQLQFAFSAAQQCVLDSTRTAA